MDRLVALTLSGLAKIQRVIRYANTHHDQGMLVCRLMRVLWLDLPVWTKR